MRRLSVMAILLMAWTALLWLPAGAQETRKKTEELSKQAARDYIKHGLILATENRHEQAVKSFEQAIKLDPTSAEAYSLMGSSLAKAGKYREAEQALRRAVELDPNYGEGYYYLGLFLQEQGKVREAEEAFRKARQCSR